MKQEKLEELKRLSEQSGHELGSAGGSKKVEIMAHFLKKHPIDAKLILDIGGSNFTYKLLKVFFPKAKVITLNLEPSHTYECESVIIGDAEDENIYKKLKNIDLIFCSDTIEHLRNPDKLMENIRTVLKKDSYVILTAPNLASWKDRLFLLFGYTPSSYDVSLKFKIGNPFSIQSSAGHISTFTFNGLIDYLEKFGFRVIYKNSYNLTEKIKPLWRIRRLLEYVLPMGAKEVSFFVAVPK
ncbi:MAG: methyltransferase domain-containing protein [Candidatus Aenigmatarchaeota archaeon]